jgi:hypothetical protein
MWFICTCRQDGHHTLLPITWFQFLIQEQLLQLHGIELQRFQWRRSCMVQKASSSTCYASFTVQNTILTAKCSEAFLAPSDLISACALHGLRNRVPYCFVLTSYREQFKGFADLQTVVEVMILPSWWSDDYVCLCCVVDGVSAYYYYRLFYLNGLNNIALTTWLSPIRQSERLKSHKLLNIISKML